MTDPFEDTTPAAESVEDLGFDAPPPEAPKKVPAKKAAAKPAVATDSDGKVTITLKGGSGFDAPWIVIHAADIPDAYEQFCGDNAALLVELMSKVQKSSVYFVGLNKDGSIRTAPRPAPQQAQQAPPGAPECPPGWSYKSGVNKNTGKPWQGYFPPRGDDTKPIFF